MSKSAARRSGVVDAEVAAAPPVSPDFPRTEDAFTAKLKNKIMEENKYPHFFLGRAVWFWVSSVGAAAPTSIPFRATHWIRMMG